MFAERELERELASRNYCARIISEELGDHVYPKGGNPEFTLIFDPIDGSTNAILGIPFFCSSIAYSPNVDHVTFDNIEASVVATIYGKTYHAERGSNAFVDGKNLPRDFKGKTKPIFSIYTYGAESIPESVIQFQKSARNVIFRVLGSIAIEICMVAEGVIDAVLDLRGLISGYDIAGAALILKEAGGIVTDRGGEELRSELGQMHNIDLVAALEPEMHRQMLAVLASK